MFPMIPYSNAPIEDWEIHRIPRVILKAVFILYPNFTDAEILIGKHHKDAPPPLRDILLESRFRDYCIRSEKLRRIRPRPEADPETLRKEIEELSEKIIRANHNIVNLEEELFKRALRKLGQLPEYFSPSKYDKAFLDWCLEKDPT
ncbi:MAG: hypothetical protein WC824_10020 [Bacteroidota bacterium]|jgi:hypothetical protein